MVRLYCFDNPRVTFDKFDLGNLALARALGDFEFKKNYSLTPDKQIITSNPDITVHDITEDDEFFVLACDGVWSTAWLLIRTAHRVSAATI